MSAALGLVTVLVSGMRIPSGLLAGALLIVTASGPEVGGVDGGGALDGGFETGGLETELVTVMVLLAVPVALSLAVAASVTT